MSPLLTSSKFGNLQEWSYIVWREFWRHTLSQGLTGQKYRKKNVEETVDTKGIARSDRTYLFKNIEDKSTCSPFRPSPTHLTTANNYRMECQGIGLGTNTYGCSYIHHLPDYKTCLPVLIILRLNVSEGSWLTWGFPKTAQLRTRSLCLSIKHL